MPFMKIIVPIGHSNTGATAPDNINLGKKLAPKPNQQTEELTDESFQILIHEVRQLLQEISQTIENGYPNKNK
jgi:hypothetical protein